jgi:hypothetical protein
MVLMGGDEAGSRGGGQTSSSKHGSTKCTGSNQLVLQLTSLNLMGVQLTGLTYWVCS